MRSYRVPLVLAFGFLAAAGSAQSQTRINAILNAASNLRAGLPGSAIAQGSIFVAFVNNGGPATLAQAGFPLPTTFEGTSIRISSGGNEVSAFIIYTSANQIAGILPSSTPVGRATARLTYNGQTSEPFAFDVVERSPGIFTLNSGGTGPAVLTFSDFQPVTYLKAANPGEPLSVWVTGLGPTNRPDNQPAEFFDPQVAVEVIVGGRPANVRYRGRAPGLAGLDQVVFDVPSGLSGCLVSLVIRAGGVVSNFTSIAVAANGRTCSDPQGLTAQEIEAAGSGNFRIGTIGLVRTRVSLATPIGNISALNDSGTADFAVYNAGTFVRSQSVGFASYGSCTVFTNEGEAETTPSDPFARTGLNAGAALTITGPLGMRTLTRQADGSYSGTLGQGASGLPGGLPGLPGGGDPPFLDPGNYTVTGPGGADVGPFTARITIPQPLNFNLAAINSVQRSAGFTLTWTGGQAGQFVVVAGSSSRINPELSATFLCIGPASAGQLRVPPEVTSALPPSATVEGAPTGSLFVLTSPDTNNRFTATGIDVGNIVYATGDLKTLPYQ